MVVACCVKCPFGDLTKTVITSTSAAVSVLRISHERGPKLSIVKQYNVRPKRKMQDNYKAMAVLQVLSRKWSPAWPEMAIYQKKKRIFLMSFMPPHETSDMNMLLHWRR